MRFLIRIEFKSHLSNALIFHMRKLRSKKAKKTCSKYYTKKPHLLTLNQCSFPTAGMVITNNHVPPYPCPPGQISLMDQSPPVH